MKMNSSSLSHRVQLMVASAGVSGLACASMFLSGGRIVDHDFSSSAVASYRATSCIQLANNSPVSAPQDLTWHLIREGGVVKLFERESRGNGTLIENHWTDANGDHFFVRVQKTGWEYVIPATPSVPTARLVYTGVSTTDLDDVERPVSVPTVRCELATYGTASTTAPAATQISPTGETVDSMGAQGPAPSQAGAPPAAAAQSPAAQAAAAAEPVMGATEANQRIAAIMGSDFTAGQFARAEHGLLDVLVACGNSCGPAVNATIWMHLGVVRGVGLHNQKKALEAFKIGLKQDRSAAPQTSCLDAPTLATFQKALRELRNQ